MTVSDTEKEALLGRIREHRAGVIDDEKRLHCAVCIPMIRTEDGFDILFEVRSGKIPAQPGDVCLPGGRMEPGETPLQTAVRETCEELKIRPEQLEPVGEADVLREGNVVLRPFAAILSDYGGSFSMEEVAEVFRVPLSFFLETEPDTYTFPMTYELPENFPFERIVGGRKYAWRQSLHEALFYEYGGRTIWGFTARVMRAFAVMLSRPD
ncbi:MAG: CoA pyrophosphatase [Oscillospiraceae bacterium]|nr:CoA pyrophosphatase [Oscillospiraceae bacterium]